MIEFKAECGHTVRARDEDSGGVVRCSYCGKAANVPDDSGDELDFLFSDADQATDGASGGLPGSAARPRRRRDFNPFAVVLRLCYAALLIIIVIFVGRKFVIPLIQGTMEVSQTPSVPEAPDSSGGGSTDIVRPATPSGRLGLTIRELDNGALYVLSTSERASACFMLIGPGASGSPFFADQKRTACSGGKCEVGQQRDNKKEVVVEVTLPIRDGSLRGLPGYIEFRRALEDAVSDEVRRQIIAKFFLPDGSLVYFRRSADQEFIVRQYRGVELRKDRPSAVRALFLPRIVDATTRHFSIGALFTNGVVPDQPCYRFDKREVEEELRLYDVPELDRPLIIDSLERIGTIPYVTADGRVRLFKIDAHNGWFKQVVIDDSH